MTLLSLTLKWSRVPASLLFQMHLVHQFLMSYHIRFTAELPIAQRAHIDHRLLLLDLRMMAADVSSQILAMHIRVVALIARKLTHLRVCVAMMRQMVRVAVSLITIFACESSLIRVLNLVLKFKKSKTPEVVDMTSNKEQNEKNGFTMRNVGRPWNFLSH